LADTEVGTGSLATESLDWNCPAAVAIGTYGEDDGGVAAGLAEVVAFVELCGVDEGGLRGVVERAVRSRGEAAD
jgi:hypothetical protein